MSNTPRYSLDLYSFFNEDPPAEESTTQSGIIPRPTPNVAAPVVEDPTKEVYGFMPTMTQLIEAEYPQGLSRATLPKDRFSLTKSVLEDYLNDLTPSGDDPLLLDEQGRPAESIRPVMRNADLTAPVGDTESMRPTMAPERVAEAEAPTAPTTTTPAEPQTESVTPATPEPTATDTTTATSTFATITKGDTSSTVDTTASLTAGFDSLTQSEGTDIHLDGRGFVTLPHGIVPDSGSVKKADGTAFNPTGSHGLKRADLAGVDYSGATKFGISRTSYDSDEAWAKAVYAEFADRAATEFGSGFDDLSDTAKEAAYDMAWNAGIGAAGWSSVKTMLNETAKDVADQSTANLIGFTTNFKSGTDYPRGLLKRRLQTYNLVAKAGDEASEITTESVMTDGVRTGTKYLIKRSDGTTLKTWTKPDTDEKIGTLQVPQ